MGKNLFLLDIIFYVVVPLCIWNFGRDLIGDYYAMLLSSVPGIIYTLIRFMKTKQWNITGLFIISTLVIGIVIDLFSGSAIRLLWNNVYYSFFMGVFFFFTILIKKPMALLFALDFTELQGYDRKISKGLFNDRRVYFIFVFLTFALAIRPILIGIINSILIKEYGVEAFDQGIILKNVIGWIFTGVTVIGYLYVAKVIQNITSEKAPIIKDV